MSNDRKDKIIATSKESFDMVCEEMFEDFLRGIQNMPEKEKEKAQNILREMNNS